MRLRPGERVAVLTVDFDRLGVRAGDRVLDLGCGGGRHAFELYRRGADVTAFDRDAAELRTVERMFGAMRLERQVPDAGSARTVHGDALELPFPDGHFDHVVAAEVLEHVQEDERVMAELVRVLRPGGGAAVSVPRWWPERVCWALSAAYHQVEGGHVRIYTARALGERLTDAGLTAVGRQHVHGLHAPYWWLKCAVGVDRHDHPLPRLYHRLLVWDLMKGPWVTRSAERLLNPLLGKSLVLYLHKPVAEAGRAAA